MMKMIGKPKIVFHHSVTGASHRRKAIPCQDASADYVSGSMSFSIAAVSDGHGDPTCLRSDRGSAIAVSETIRCLMEFGEYYPNLAAIEAECNVCADYPECLRQLTDAVVSRWSAAVIKDLEEHGLTEQEYENAGTFEAKYRQGECQERIYGATLIAALEGEDYLLLLQQGDGRCDLLYSDGTMKQPIPDDERCYGNVTTSLSDDFAAKEIRSILLTENGSELTACFISTDGVDNGLYDEESLLQFYLETGMKLADGTSGEQHAMLETVLNEVSVNGNGDDVSLAGWLEPEMFRKIEPDLMESIRKNQEDEAIAWAENKLISMERKLEILQGRVRSASPDEKAVCMKEYMDYRIQYNRMKEKAEELIEKQKQEGE